MAYTSSNLKAMGMRVGDCPIWWAYTSTADAVATCTGADFFSDGYDKGVRKSDLCIITDGGSTVHSIGIFYTVTASSAATLAVGNLSSTI